MAHNLEIIEGEAAHFYVGETPWHGLGHRFINPPTAAEALEAAKLNWEVGLRPLFNEHNQQSKAWETYRMDTGAMLGWTGSRYHPLQNTDAINFFSPLLETGLLQFETAGVLGGGEKIWVMAKVAGEPVKIINDDIVEKYILLSNSHDGTTAIRVGFTPVRVVCQNTLAIAMSAKETEMLRIRHSRNAIDALERVRDIMDVANQTFAATEEQFKFLATRGVNAKDLQKFVMKVLGIKSAAELEDSKPATKILELFISGKGQDMKGVKGTYWAAYQAVTEYLSHDYGRNLESRHNALWFGQSNKMNRKALELAVEMAKAA